MDLAKEETYPGHWTHSRKTPQIKTPERCHLHLCKKVARRRPHGEGRIWSREAPTHKKLSAPHFQAPCSHARPAQPLRVSGGAQSPGGEGRGSRSLGAANQQRVPAVAPVTWRRSLRPTAGGRWEQTATRARGRRGRRTRSQGSARARPLTRGRRGRGAGTRMRAPGAVAGGGGGSSSVGDPKAERQAGRQAGGRCRGRAPQPRRASPP